MKPRVLLAILSLSGSLACSDAHAPAPAADCAEAVRIYRHLPEPVRIVGQPSETSEGSVQLQYEGADAAGAPVKGSAACTFAVGDGGALTLVEAVVDGSPVGAKEVDAIRAELGERR